MLGVVRYCYKSVNCVLCDFDHIDMVIVAELSSCKVKEWTVSGYMASTD